MRDAVGPFDKREPAGFEIFVRAEFEKFIIVFEAVRIEVVNRQAAARVFVYEDERRAGNAARRNAERGGDRLHEPRLARAERADERDRSARRQHFGQRGAEAGSVLFVVGGNNRHAIDASSRWVRAAGGSLRWIVATSRRRRSARQLV